MPLRDILVLARKWLWLIILACLIGGLAGMVVDHYQPKKYEADATLFVSSPNHSDYNALLGDQQAATALAQYAKSDSVLLAGLQKVGESKLNLSKLTSMVTVQNDLNSQFVTIKVVDNDPQQAALLASDIAKEAMTRFEATVTDSSIAQTLRAEIASLALQIKNQETELAALERQAPQVVGTPTPEQTTTLNQLNQLTTDLNTLRQLYTEDVNSYTNLTSIQVTLVQDAQVPQKPVGPGAPLSVAIGMLAGLIAIAGIILFIEQTDDVLRTPAKVEKASGLSTFITVKHVPRLAKQVLLLNGNGRMKEDTSRRQLLPVVEVQSSQQDVNQQGEDEGPITTKRLTTAAERAPWLKNHREFAQATDPSLKAIAKQSLPVVVYKAQAGSAKPAIGTKTPANGFQLPESFLALGVFLRGERSQVASKGGNLRLLLITSAEDGDGKTLIASQVALGLARVGVETILVDANLHKPAVHNLFKLPNRICLSSILTTIQLDDDLYDNDSYSSSDLDDANSKLLEHTFAAVQRVSEPNLSVLPGGPSMDLSPELLSSPKMKTIFEHLSEKAFVVIDGPAVLTSSESVILANRSDAVLMVVNARRTSGTKLNQSLEMLSWVNTDILGVVLNQVGK